MKLANVTPVHKKGSQSEKGNYRPVSILPNLSKVFERCIYKQIYEYFENILSKYQCGFRKGHSAQHCLIALLEKWRKSIDRGSEFGILLTDLRLLIAYYMIYLLLNYLHMDLTIRLFVLHMTFLKIVSKELKFLEYIVAGKKYFTVFHKDLF